jgi:hypothetical protein
VSNKEAVTMYETLSRSGARLGNWNDRRQRPDTGRDRTMSYVVVDRVASWLYKLPERSVAVVSWALAVTSVVVLVLFLLAAPAHAQSVPGAGDVAPVPDGPALTVLPIGVIVVSFVMTAIGYLLNHMLPFLRTDAQKGVAHVFYQVIGVELFELATGSGFGINKQTGVAFVVAMATWGFSHGLIYKPTTWAPLLGAGRHAGDPPTRRKSDARP